MENLTKYGICWKGNIAWQSASNLKIGRVLNCSDHKTSKFKILKKPKLPRQIELLGLGEKHLWLVQKSSWQDPVRVWTGEQKHHGELIDLLKTMSSVRVVYASMQKEATQVLQNTHRGEQQNLDWRWAKLECTQKVESGTGFLVISNRCIAQVYRGEFRKAVAKLDQGL